MITLQYTIYKDLVDSGVDIGIFDDFNVINTRKSIIFEAIPGRSERPLSVVKKLIPGGKFQMCGYETGGGKTSSGYVCVTCSPNGKKLVPTHIFQGYNTKFGNTARQASFVADKLAQIHLYRQRRLFSCYMYIYHFTGYEFVCIPIYAVEKVGEQEIRVPSEFSEALRAAIDKSYIYHCDEPKFVLEKRKEKKK